jgi:hypothetical protein
MFCDTGGGKCESIFALLSLNNWWTAVAKGNMDDGKKANGNKKILYSNVN